MNGTLASKETRKACTECHACPDSCRIVSTIAEVSDGVDNEGYRRSEDMAGICEGNITRATYILRETSRWVRFYLGAKPLYPLKCFVTFYECHV